MGDGRASERTARDDHLTVPVAVGNADSTAGSYAHAPTAQSTQLVRVP